MNPDLSKHVDGMFNGKCGSIGFGATLEEGVTGLLHALMSWGSISLVVSYFSSEGREGRSVEDALSCHGMGKGMDVARNPHDSKFPDRKERFKATPEEYAQGLVFPRAISFMEFFILSGDEYAECVRLNFTRKAQSPMEMVPLDGGSYITRVTFVPYVELSFEPKK